MQINLIVDELLEERQQLLTTFCSLVGIDVWGSDVSHPTLERFCQLLVDYSGMLHFELLSNLAEHEHEHPELMDVAKDVYEPCVVTTQAILDFNECYIAVEKAEQLATVGEALSALGEVMADRFELEDRLINAMLTSGYLNQAAT